MNLIPWRNKRQQNAPGESTEHLPARLRDATEQWMERFFRDPWGFGFPNRLTQGLEMGPRIDLSESENEVTVTAELPGVDPKNVEVKVSGNLLTISGEKTQEKQEKKRNYHYVERQYGSFQRTVQLPTTVDPGKVEAAYKDGVLTVTIAKHPGARPRKITVKQA